MNIYKILFFLLLLTSCQNQSKENMAFFTGNAMTIDYTIMVGHRLSDKEKLRIEKIIEKTFLETHAIYNKWNPHSELSRLNQAKAGQAILLSPQLESLLLLTKQIVELTEGRFDPSIEPLQKLWKENLNLGKEPSKTRIAEVIPSVGWYHIKIDNHIFTKDHDLTSLDLGGIAKGYCVDLLVERILSEGFTNIFVEWGGEISVKGEHPDKRPWKIFISAFGDINPDHAISTLKLENQAIATSGDYLQNWQIGETTYYHIIDPIQLKPMIIQKNTPASVSVLASSCAFADGLATAAMMFPDVQEAENWAKDIKNKHPELEFWIVGRELRTDHL